MQRSLLATPIALFAWAIFAPGSWLGVVHSQTTILATTGTVDTSQPCTIRGPAFYQRTHTIELTAGNQYTIDLRSTAADHDGTGYHPDGDPYLYLLNSSNTIVAENDDVIMGGGGTGIENRSLILYDAMVSGTYTIIVTSWSSAVTFPYTLNVTARPLVTTADGTLSGPDPTFVDPRGAGYYAGRTPVTLTAGQPYQIDVTGAPGASGSFNDYVYDVDTYIYLLDSSGAIIARDDNYGNGYASRIVFTPTTSGTYTVLVSSFAPGATFRYHVTVTGLTPTSIPPTQPATAPLPPGGGIPNVHLSPRLDRLPLRLTIGNAGSFSA